MRPRDAGVFLQDVVQNCAMAAGFAAGRSYEDYTQDAMLRYSVERAVMIVGEALTQALRVRPDLADHITQAEQIVAFRHRLVHGYSTLDPGVVWGIVTGDLPILAQQAAAVLAELESKETQC